MSSSVRLSACSTGVVSRLTIADPGPLVVKNPLSPVEHPGGVGVNCEMFEAGLDQFVVSVAVYGSAKPKILTAGHRHGTCHDLTRTLQVCISGVG